MPNPVCTVATLTTGAACFKKFTQEQRKSLMIYFNALELAAIGGTNYTTQLGQGGTLMADAACYRNLPNPATPISEYRLVLARNNAINAGAVPASTNDALAAAISCNENFGISDKAAQMLALECQLGSHKAYPQ